MSQTTRTFSARDGYPLAIRFYPAAGSRPLGHVVCLHGIQSHGGWYVRSCTQLAAAGYNVHFLDRRGSGLNAQARGDTPSFRVLLDDIADYLNALRRNEGGAPLFLLAVSWGGKLAVGLQRRLPPNENPLAGMALLCPGLCPRVRPTFGERLRIALARLVAPRRLFDIPLNDPALFTASPRWQQFLRDDPDRLHQATARLLVESVRLDGYVRRSAPAVTLPVLLMLGGQDRIIDNARTRGFVESFPSPDRQVIEYPEAHHTLEFEDESHPWLNDLLAWLGRHTTSGTHKA